MTMRFPRLLALALMCLAMQTAARAAVGDPQVRTDHPWYPGELSCSTFDRLFRTQAALYERTTGRPASTDEDKSLASWYWRNLHFAHAEEGCPDTFDEGFQKSDHTREYWTGLFAHGFALCGTTHAQWTAELNALLGHCRSRVAGVSGHNSFEVFLTGAAYGQGRWALLDHDISTVIFHPDGSRLLSIDEIVPMIRTLKDPRYKPARQRGWRVSGLHDDDAGGVYTAYNTAEYLAGYAGPPPMVHLRAGESLRRYLNPGLNDGKTFVFWGMNYRAGGTPGIERSRTWVNQPEKMFGSTSGTGYRASQARYANAVYTYTPDFTRSAYREAVIDESNQHVTFEFYTPYVIAATPANEKPWGIYDAGGRNGLVITGRTNCSVQISTDQGRTWQSAALTTETPLDLTDFAKGHQQFLLRFGAGAAALRSASLSWRVVCQCNSTIIPRLHDGENRITFAASGRALFSAGPNLDQAAAHLVQGRIGSDTATLELTAPRNHRAVHVYAAGWNASGAPPSPTVYRIDYSIDGGASWRPIVKDWRITRRTPEPRDFWSQSFCYADAPIDAAPAGAPVRVRFTNDGKRPLRKVEAHLAYAVDDPSPTQVTFAWREAFGQVKTATHRYTSSPGVEDASWVISTGRETQTLWVEYAASPASQ